MEQPWLTDRLNSAPFFAAYSWHRDADSDPFHAELNKAMDLLAQGVWAAGVRGRIQYPEVFHDYELAPHPQHREYLRAQ